MAPLFSINFYFDCKIRLCIIVPGRHEKIYFCTRKFLSTKYSQRYKQDTSFLDCKHKHMMKCGVPLDKFLVWYRIIISPYLGQEKKFGSGQLIFENWSGSPVEVFFLNHSLYFPNLIFQQVIKLGIQIQPVIDMSVMARIFFICVKIDPPDDQNQDIFFLALYSYIVSCARLYTKQPQMQLIL